MGNNAYNLDYAVQSDVILCMILYVNETDTNTDVDEVNATGLSLPLGLAVGLQGRFLLRTVGVVRFVALSSLSSLFVS